MEESSDGVRGRRFERSLLIKRCPEVVKKITLTKEVDSVFSFEATVTNFRWCVLKCVRFLVMFDLALGQPLVEEEFLYF